VAVKDADVVACRVLWGREGPHSPSLYRRAGARLPTLPVARAVITEILTAHFFVTRPHYLRTMQKLAEINLRI
jgi:hypothetical protein